MGHTTVLLHLNYHDQETMETMETMETNLDDTPCKHKELWLVDEISIGSMSEDEFVDEVDCYEDTVGAASCESSQN